MTVRPSLVEPQGNWGARAGPIPEKESRLEMDLQPEGAKVPFTTTACRSCAVGEVLVVSWNQDFDARADRQANHLKRAATLPVWRATSTGILALRGGVATDLRTTGYGLPANGHVRQRGVERRFRQNREAVEQLDAADGASRRRRSTLCNAAPRARRSSRTLAERRAPSPQLIHVFDGPEKG